jgi:hypothetical protein
MTRSGGHWGQSEDAVPSGSVRNAAARWWALAVFEKLHLTFDSQLGRVHFLGGINRAAVPSIDLRVVSAACTACGGSLSVISSPRGLAPTHMDPAQARQCTTRSCQAAGEMEANALLSPPVFSEGCAGQLFGFSNTPS